MNTVLLILKKDFKRYAWALITLLILSLIEVYLYGTNAGMAESKVNTALGFLSGSIRNILFFLLIVMVVQEETMSDPDAYWLARPLNRLHILASKICFLLALLGIGAFTESILLILNAGVSRIGYSFATAILLGLAIWQWQVFLAAQTRSLPRYLLVLVCFVVGFYALMMFMAFSAGDLGIEDLGLLPNETPGHLLAAIQIILWISAGTLTLTIYYLKRQKRYAWGCILPALLLSAVLTPRDSVLGTNINFFDEGEVKLELLSLSQSGTMHTEGKEYVTINGIFKAIDTDKDVWVTPNYVNIQNKSSEIEIMPYRSCQTVEPTIFNNSKAIEVRLFSIERESLSALPDKLDISIGYNLSTSTQQEVARIPVEAGFGLTHDGNRLILQDFYTSDSKLTLNLDAYLPNFALEPEAPTPASEPLKGKYSIDVYSKSDKAIRDARVNSNWFSLEAKTSARIEIPHEESKAPDDLEIIVYEREVEKTNYGHDYSSGISIKRN